jgi:hypothetical protein
MIAESKQKLRTLQEADDARTAKEAALNELEGYIYKVRAVVVVISCLSMQLFFMHTILYDASQHLHHYLNFITTTQNIYTHTVTPPPPTPSSSPTLTHTSTSSPTHTHTRR